MTQPGNERNPNSSQPADRPGESTSEPGVSYGAAPPPASPSPYGAPPPSGYPGGAGPAGRSPTPKPRRGLLIAIVVAVVAVGAIIVGVLLANRLPDPAPVVSGNDSALNSLARSCFDGDMGACDDLFRLSPLNSAYETYGNTCGGRVPAAEVRMRLCADIF